MAKIKLTEDQLNRLVEMEHKSVFKDEHKMKDAVESHLSEEKKLCGCGCEIGKCECGPECTKCDCGKKKEAKEDWDPTGSVGVNGVSADVARKGMNTLWEQEQMGINGIHQEPFFGAHPGIGWTGASGYNYGKIDFESEMPGVFKTVEVESLEQAQQALGLSDSEFMNLIGGKWYGSNPEYLFNIFKNNRGNLILKIRNKKEEDPKAAFLNQMTKDQMDHDEETLRREIGEDKSINESILKNFKRLIR